MSYFNFKKQNKLFLVFCFLFLSSTLGLVLKSDILKYGYYTVIFCMFTPLFLAIFIYFFKNLFSALLILKIYITFYTYAFLTLSIFTIIVLQTSGVVIYIKFYDFVCFEDFLISFDFFFNPTTIFMFYVVFSVSFLVSLFSIWYMHSDPNSLKFLSLITCFSFFMLVLVCSNNLIMVFVGWEGIGLFSYLLINFWNTRTSANRSALKAILINKIGDCFFYLFIFAYWFIFRTFSIYETTTSFCLSKGDFTILNLKYNYILVILLLIAAMAKSAQIILHVWLPDAMEGPTPVSALLHAATMVTAGIFILIKINHILEYNENMYKVILWVGLITNLVASFIAMFQYDIKKVIAYSTASQIGIIFIAFGIMKMNLSLFHIYNHGYFKAFLFVLAGILIHYFLNRQDLRVTNKLNYDKYFIYFCFLICAFSLMSMPFFSGYYSKEFIIQNSYLSANILGSVSFYMLNFSAVTTTIYSLRILYFLFFSLKSLVIYKRNANGEEKPKLFLKLNVFNLSLFFICVVFTFFSVFSGYLGYQISIFSFIKFHNDFLDYMPQTEKIFMELFNEHSTIFITIIQTSFSVLFTSIFCLPCYFVRNGYSYYFNNVINKKFFYNDVYRAITFNFLNSNYIISYILDKNIMENIVIYILITVDQYKSKLKCYINTHKITIIIYFVVTLQLIALTFIFNVSFAYIVHFFVVNTISTAIYDKIEKYFTDRGKKK